MPLSTGAGVGVANCEYTTTNIPAFLSKLWTLVEDPKYNELIAWDPSGFSFHVFDQTNFSREILPRFFKHNNMASFIRQLNMYGFRKVNSIDHGSLKNEKEDMEFHHPYFIKGKEQFLEYIKRKVPDVKSVNNNTSNSSSGSSSNNALATTNNNTSSTGSSQISNQQQSAVLTLQQYPPIKPDELNKMLDDVNTMKSKQKMVDDSLFNVKKENEALWKEIASLRQKHHHQQQIVNKLIHFLVHLVNPTSIGLKRSRPLMIDSHSASALVNSAANAGSKFANSDNGEDPFTEFDNDEDEDIYVNDSNSNRRQFIELEEDDENENNNSKSSIRPNFIEENESSLSSLSPASTANLDLNRTKNKKDFNRFNYINETEIETINNAKTNINTNNMNKNLSEQPIEPAFKRMRTISNNNNSLLSPIQQQQPQQQQQSPPPQQQQNNTIQHQSNQQLQQQKRSFNNQNSIGNMFLNDTNNIGLITSEINTNSIISDENQSTFNSVNNLNMINTPPLSLSNTQSNSPIVSMPASPNLLLNNKNSNISLINSNDTANINNNIIDLMPFNDTKRSISNSYQMNDHVESLQLDLNSIKEFLTSNSFNQIDSFTINNLFSPIVLDQSDNEPNYLEAPTILNNSDQSQSLQLPTMLQLNNNNNTNTSSNINNNTNNTGKIIGNELIQYEPFMAADFLAFNADDLISKDTKTTIVKSDPEVTIPASDYINDLFPEQIDKSSEDNKWDLIEDNYIITNPNESLFNDS